MSQVPSRNDINKESSSISATKQDALKTDKDNIKPQVSTFETVETEKSKVDFAKDDKFQYYPDKPDAPLNKMKFVVKGASQFYDPCEESSKMSFKCLELNDYDREMCRTYFDAYRECKKQWLANRRSNGGQWK